MTDVQFIPWIRSGLAGLAEGNSGEITIDLSLTAQRADGQGQDAQDLTSRAVRLAGPGEVVALGPDQLLRRDPAPGAREVEPNYFASVEIA